ncbi:hypothetical protein [Micromonospora sp. NPDC048839]|uniref:hypothetical protein n=1 Tax=Micromonospora sp. NPDC048839 TaxID=3155641 RepID=UPI00340A061E
MPDPLWIDASSGAPAYSAAELRQNMALALMFDGRNMGARAGVRPGGNQLLVSLAGSTITAQPGVLCLDPGLSTPQGPYWVAIPAAETHTLTAADASNPRKDIVVARVYDTVEDSSGLRLARTEYIAGVANPSPAEPSVPAGATRLATIDVPKVGGGSPAVTDRRRYTAAAGGIVPVAADADISAAVAGRYRHNLATGQLEQDTGTVWRRADWWSSWGRVGGRRYQAGSGVLLADNTGSEAVTNVHTGSVPVVAGRSYHIRMSGRVVTSASAALIMRVRDDAGLGAVTGTERGAKAVETPANASPAWENEILGYFDATVTESRTFILTGTTLSGGHKWYAGSATSPVVAEVIDIGPTLLTVVP